MIYKGIFANIQMSHFLIDITCTQTEEEALREAQERRRLEEEVKEQRALIDALTVESLTLREESATLQVELFVLKQYYPDIIFCSIFDGVCCCCHTGEAAASDI